MRQTDSLQVRRVLLLRLVFFGSVDDTATQTFKNFVPKDIGHDRHQHDGYSAQPEESELVNEHGNVRSMDAKIVSEQRPFQDPKRAAECVEHQEPPPVHLDGAGDDAVQLAQHIEEASESPGHGTIACEYNLDLVQSRGSQSNCSSVSPCQLVAEHPADRVAEIVSDNGAGPCLVKKARERQIAALSENCRENEQRLAGKWRPPGLEDQNHEDGRNTVVMNPRLQRSQFVSKFRHCSFGRCWIISCIPMLEP
jgi:hypothetical protein